MPAVLPAGHRASAVVTKAISVAKVTMAIARMKERFGAGDVGELVRVCAQRDTILVTMTYMQMAHEAHRLTPADKWALVQFLLRDLQTAFGTTQTQPNGISIAARVQVARSLYGALRPAAGPTPSDDDVRESYTQHLIEKYQGQAQ